MKICQVSWSPNFFFLCSLFKAIQGVLTSKKKPAREKTMVEIKNTAQNERYVSGIFSNQ